MKKRKKKSLEPGSFGEVFRLRLEKIEADAKAAGANFTIVCKLARISRAGPVRWTNSLPQTIKIVDKMERVVKRLAEKAKQKAESTEN
jgi:hypothetical protein